MAVTIRDLAEQHWNGEADLVHEHHPVRPALRRVGEEIAPDVFTLISVASVNAIDTGDGLVGRFSGVNGVNGRGCCRGLIRIRAGSGRIAAPPAANGRWIRIRSR